MLTRHRRALFLQAVLAVSAPISTAFAARVSIVYSFQAKADGAYPDALIKLGNAFYGTTFNGGANFGGTVFKVTPQGQETTLHTFGPIESGDGRQPVNGVIGVDGTLYGTTENGGSAGTGTVFALTPGGAETVLHSFTGGKDGATPLAALVGVGGALYGTTASGGVVRGSPCQSGCGTVFRITPDGHEQVIHVFKGGPEDGANPYASLIHSGNAFYGVTRTGGTHGYGTVFRLTDSGQETILHSFTGTPDDGAYPVGALAELGGNFYGTTENGGMAQCSGNPGCGVVFKISRTGAETVLHEFSSANGDGYHPINGLNTLNRQLIGTTEVGGATNSGVLYAITPGGVEKIFVSFRGKKSVTSPVQSVVKAGGAFWGASFYGGAGCGPTGGCGAVYKVTP